MLVFVSSSRLYVDFTRGSNRLERSLARTQHTLIRHALGHTILGPSAVNVESAGNSSTSMFAPDPEITMPGFHAHASSLISQPRALCWYFLTTSLQCSPVVLSLHNQLLRALCNTVTPLGLLSWLDDKVLLAGLTTQTCFRYSNGR